MMDETEMARRLAAVRRMALGMAATDGLLGAKIQSASEFKRNPISEEALDAKNPVGKQSDGGRYFIHVRQDGRGQIMIHWPNGLEKTIKFWIPEEMLADQLEYQLGTIVKPAGASSEENLENVTSNPQCADTVMSVPSLASIKSKEDTSIPALYWVAFVVLMIAIFPPMRDQNLVFHSFVLGERGRASSVALGHLVAECLAGGLGAFLIAKSILFTVRKLGKSRTFLYAFFIGFSGIVFALGIRFTVDHWSQRKAESVRAEKIAEDEITAPSEWWSWPDSDGLRALFLESMVQGKDKYFADVEEWKVKGIITDAVAAKLLWPWEWPSPARDDWDTVDKIAVRDARMTLLTYFFPQDSEEDNRANGGMRSVAERLHWIIAAGLDYRDRKSWKNVDMVGGEEWKKHSLSLTKMREWEDQNLPSIELECRTAIKLAKNRREAILAKWQMLWESLSKDRRESLRSRFVNGQGTLEEVKRLLKSPMD